MLAAFLVAWRCLSYTEMSVINGAPNQVKKHETCIIGGGDSNNSGCNLVSKVAFSNLLHLAHSLGQDFFRSKQFTFAIDFNLNIGLVMVGNDCIGEALDIVQLVEFAADETPRARLANNLGRKFSGKRVA